MYYETIQLAEKQNITLLKLPARTTDLLQPLHVPGFKSLKEPLREYFVSTCKFEKVTSIQIGLSNHPFK